MKLCLGCVSLLELLLYVPLNQEFICLVPIEVYRMEGGVWLSYLSLKKDLSLCIRGTSTFLSAFYKVFILVMQWYLVSCNGMENVGFFGGCHSSYVHSCLARSWFQLNIVNWSILVFLLYSGLSCNG